jgi:hypothetical protein
MQASTAGTYSAGTGTTLFGYDMQTRANGYGPFFFTNNPYLIVLFPGETITLTTQGYTGNITAGLFWEEQF